MIIVGGTGVISAGVASQLESLTGGGVVRLAGSNRYETAAVISQFLFPFGADTVYLATALNFPDALSGGPAAAMDGAPILLVAAGDLTAATHDELVRLAPTDIVLLGGASAISDAVAAQAVSATGASVTRLSGSNRYATSAAISASAFDPGVDVAYIAFGGNFPDALAGGPPAGLRGGPILLVDNDMIPDVIQTELQRLVPAEIVILGGPAVVSDSVADDLAAFTTGAVSRLSGANRFATAAAISADNFPEGVHAVIVATAGNFPDALAAGPMGAFGGFPLILVNQDSVPQATTDEINRLTPTPHLGHTITTVDAGDGGFFHNVGVFTSIGIAGDNHPTIAYSVIDANRMMVAHCGDAACANAASLGPRCCNGGGYEISLEIRGDGLPTVASTPGGTPYLTICETAICENFPTTRVLSPVYGPDQAGHTAMALGADGNPIVGYRLLGDPALVFCGSESCPVYTTVTVSDAGESGSDLAIAIGADDHPVISFYNATSGDLKFFRCNEAGLPCTGSPIIIDSAGDVGLFTSLAIGSDGFPVISYYSADDFALKVAHCDDAVCSGATITTIDGGFHVAGLFATDTSITIAPDGYPIISYYELVLPYLGRLKIADCANVTCTSGVVTVVDSYLDVGASSSITIGTDGNPVISYYDFWHGDLKVAHISD